MRHYRVSDLSHLKLWICIFKLCQKWAMEQGTYSPNFKDPKAFDIVYCLGLPYPWGCHKLHIMKNILTTFNFELWDLF